MKNGQAGSSHSDSIGLSSRSDVALQLSETKRPNAKERDFLERVWLGDGKRDSYLAVWPDTKPATASMAASRLINSDKGRTYSQELAALADANVGLTKARLLRGYEEIFEDESQPMSARIAAGQETAKLKGYYEAKKVEAKLGIMALFHDDGDRTK